MKKTTALTIIALALNTLLNINNLQAQNIGINGTGAMAHASALLDVDAVATPSLGILIPRIALQAINVASPVSSPATSLLVYNTASASTGTNAVSPGYYYWDGAKWVRFAYNASGSSSTAWDLLGNAGTNPSTNFLGTTDNQDVVFRRNSTRAGLIGANNTSFGNNALNTSSTGQYNTAVGAHALRLNTTGQNSTAVGFEAMNNFLAGSENTAVGAYALTTFASGFSNSAFGNEALRRLTGGNSNTAIGNSAMFGAASTAIASSNVAVGSSALYSYTNCTGNVAIGSSSLFDNKTGNYNSAIGHLAVWKNTTGSYNVGLGYYAMQTNTVGSNNTCIGASSNVSADGLSNATALGNSAIVNASNKVRLGNSSVSVVEGQVAYSFPSDGRFKTITNNEVKGLEFITKLKPITYTFDTKKFDEFLTKNMPDSIRQQHMANTNYEQTQRVIHTGFIAQEVEKAANETGFVFDAVHTPNNDNDNYSLAYSQFVVPLVKAVQELEAKNKNYEKQIDELQQQLQTVLRKLK